MNLMKAILFVLSIISCVSSCFGFFEILAGVGSYIYYKLCYSGKCCTKNEIPGNLTVLRETLNAKLYGQPLVESIVLNALKSHWDENFEPDKALAISFHGGPGVGKNYVSKFIEEALYDKGMLSPHVHNFNARLDFPEESKVNLYKLNLIQWIKGNVSNCPKQLFVFDEVNQMPAGILDALIPFIDHADYINTIYFKRAIFIFLSNTGSKVINEHAYNLWSRGIERKDVRLPTFEKLIAQGAFNEVGGFHHSDTIKSNLIDHYVPFLPLMKPHVIKCIKEEFRKLNINNPTDDMIQEVLDFIDWGPDADHGVFAKTGCKRISQKVRLVALG